MEICVCKITGNMLAFPQIQAHIILLEFFIPFCRVHVTASESYNTSVQNTPPCKTVAVPFKLYLAHARVYFFMYM